MPWSVRGHTSDVRLRITGKTLEALFRDAMAGLVSVMAPRRRRDGGPARTAVALRGTDATALLVDFLGVALARMQADRVAYDRVRFHTLSDDYLRAELEGYAVERFGREVKAVTYHESPEGQKYFAAMNAAANFAWANRQLITWEVRRAFERAWGGEAPKLSVVYDVAHNIAKVETYGGRELVVHRKGATRAFPGQPVLIPGSMGTASYLYDSGAPIVKTAAPWMRPSRRSRRASLACERG